MSEGPPLAMPTYPRRRRMSTNPYGEDPNVVPRWPGAPFFRHDMPDRHDLPDRHDMPDMPASVGRRHFTPPKAGP